MRVLIGCAEKSWNLNKLVMAVTIDTETVGLWLQYNAVVVAIRKILSTGPHHQQHTRPRAWREEIVF